jgi:ATP-dependent RNA helicase DeaD
MTRKGEPLLLKEKIGHGNKTDRVKEKKRKAEAKPIQQPPEQGMERYRIEVGNAHGVKPGNIVGAIAGEADIDSRHIGRITIFDSFSTVDLPEGMPNDIFRLLQKVWVSNRPLKIKKASGRKKEHPRKKHKDSHGKKQFSAKNRRKKRFSASMPI